MKKIFKYLGILLSAALLGALTSCEPVDVGGSTELGLGIKVFFPTKVVAGQPMTINGTGFAEATEVVFPAGVTVTDFEIVSNDMIRVKAPAGISPEGGKIIVRTAGDEAESHIALTLGSTRISGYSKTAGESIQGGEMLTIYGQDLEFLSGIELLDEEGNPAYMGHERFYRKGTSTVIVTIPQNIFTGTFAGKLTSIDGKEFIMPEFAYEPAPTGHWEIKKTILWKNDDPEGNGVPSWSGQYRFSNVETATGEEIYAFPMEDWAIIKDGVFRLAIEPRGAANVRVTTGWWSGGYVDTEYNCAELMQEDADGTLFIEFNMKEDGNLYDNIDQQHLLLTGSDYMPLYIYTQEEVWVENGTGPEEVTIWENDNPEGNGVPSWSGQYRFSNVETATGEEIYAFPMEDWAIIKDGVFRLAIEPRGAPNVRVTTGWWSGGYVNTEYNCAELMQEDANGTLFIEFNMKEDGNLYDNIDQQHLLFTGSDYMPLRIYYIK